MTTLGQLTGLLDSLEAVFRSCQLRAPADSKFWMALVGGADVIENEADDHIDPVNRWIKL